MGKRDVGRRRVSWFKKPRTWFDMTTIQLFQTSANKVKITCLVEGEEEVVTNIKKYKKPLHIVREI